MNIDISKVTLNKRGNHYNVLFNGSSIYLTLPKMRIPFGVDNIGNDYLFKLSFYKINKNEEYQRFHNFIVELENHFRKLLDSPNLKSSIVYHPKYDPNIVIKIPTQKNGSFNCDCEDSNGTPFNIHNLEAGDDLICEIVIDTVWIGQDKFNYKIKAKKITRCV
jgi:hypothetical protein